MAHFRYKVRDSSGELASGTIEAGSLQAAGATLRQQGRFIVELAESSGPAAGKPAAARRKKVKRAEVISFAHQLATMVQTGVPISEALDCVAEQSDNPAFAQVLREVTEHVQSGNELSTAMQKHTSVFPPVMISLIRASEVSGTMGPMLDRIAQYLGKEHATARKIKGALMYPVVMLVAVTGVTVFLLTFVLPKFAGVYSTRGQALPLPTQLLMSISGFFNQYWMHTAIVAAMVATGAWMYVRTVSGRRLLDGLKLRSPLLGPLFRKLYITRGCRTMGTMIAAGVPILDMVAIVKQVTANVYFEELWDDVDDQLRQGHQLSDALFQSPWIPRSISQMIYSGEKSGRLGPTMERIAEFTEEEFDDQVKATTQFIEPAMVGIMGGVIGFVAIALLLPIFTVGKVVSG